MNVIDYFWTTEEEQIRRREKSTQIKKILFDGSCNLEDILDILSITKEEAKKIANKSLLFHK